MKSNITSFSIFKLFGTNDVHIPFDSNIKILIGENGLGKTQVLNLLYYTLSRNFFRLSEFSFEKLILNFEDKSITITSDEINNISKDFLKHPIIQDFIKEYGYTQFEIIRNKFIHYNGNLNLLEREFDFHSRYRKFPYHRIFRALEDLEVNNNIFNFQLNGTAQTILDQLSEDQIMYFPTYRRVEEDLHNLGYNEDDVEFNQDDTLIQFGMNDVQRRFEKIQNSIDKLLKEGLAQFTKEILNVVIDDLEPQNNTILEKINEEDIDIILSRVGNLLPQSQKDAVKNIIAHKQYKNPLTAYLLQKLSDIYERQKELDSAVKVFRDVCNAYLINKEVFYDESSIKIYIKSNLNSKEIKLSKLSSGEKQIISIFSKIYLSDKDKRFIVLFDEPELSLSMLWQKRLLLDIINSNKCNFLLAVTHSPFIFSNTLDKYAVGLNEYMTISENPIEQDNFISEENK